MADPQEDLLRAALAERYRIERQIGAGGMATVYLAEDLHLHLPVAVKALKPEVAAIIGRERFLREIEIAGRLKHPHILNLHDSGVAEGIPYYVMPYERESLRDRLKREKQLPVQEAMRIAREVADALDFAHRQGVVHRDIKPENILLEENHAVVGDFGIARAIDLAGGKQLTETGVVLGTPPYMSPEQTEPGREVDGRADLYSLGCVLYEMLAGQPPYMGPTAESVAYQHRAAEIPDVTSLRPTVPKEAVDTLRRALAKSPADRFASGAQFAGALEAAKELPAPAQPVPVRKLAWVVAAAVAVALGAWIVSKAGRPPPVPTSLTAVIVLPFTVRGGDEYAYLGEGMVDLLSTSLDGAAGLRRVDPRAVLSFARREDGDGWGPGRGKRIAQHFGAGLFVVGNVLRLADKLRLDASLYEQAGIEPVAEGTAEGPETDLLEMVDRLAATLVSRYTGTKPNWGGRLSSLAAKTTESMPALKAFLDGEAHFRHGRHRQAEEAYQRAVGLDSSFALAWYRLSLAAGWWGEPELARRSSEQAVRFGDKRYYNLLRAGGALYEGDFDEAVRLCRAALDVYPEDPNAWFQLAESVFHGSYLSGRSMIEARGPLERTIALDPENMEVLDHLIMVAAKEQRWAELDSLITRALALTSGEDSLVWEAFRAFAIGDSNARKRAVAGLASASSYSRLAQAVEVHLEDLVAGSQLRLLERKIAPSAFPPSFGTVARGMWRLADSEMASLEIREPTLAIASRGWLSAIPFMPASALELDRVREAVSLWKPAAEDSSHSLWLVRWLSSLHPQIQKYLLGLLDLRLGRHESALKLAAQLEETDGTAEAMNLARDYALSLRGQASLHQGRMLEALGFLERAFKKVPWPPMPWRNGLYERYLRAELLRRLGREQEALGWYTGLSELQVMELPYRAVSHLRRGEIYERMNELDKAIYHYNRFITLWKDCDPELRPMVDNARARMERLMAVQG